MVDAAPLRIVFNVMGVGFVRNLNSLLLCTTRQGSACVDGAECFSLAFAPWLFFRWADIPGTVGASVEGVQTRS